jgi:HprK-related kinase A
VTLGELTPAVLRERLRRGELLLDLGPVICRIEANSEFFASALHTLYAGARAPTVSEDVADITMQLRPVAAGLHFWLVDGRPARAPSPFTDQMTMAEFEWALHFGLATALSPALSFHGAVAVRDDGKAVAMIGKSGSGKSTLLGGLVGSGWTLCADEFFNVTADGRVIPLPGVITFKGNAVGLMMTRASDLIFGPVAEHADRGTIVHAAARRTSRVGDPIRVSALIFPTFGEHYPTSLDPIAEPDTFTRLSEQSHNAHVLGAEGFHMLARVARTPAWALWFSDLDAGLARIRSTLEEGS